MSRGVNRATIVGNLGADPEVRSTGSGTRVATLSVATNRAWRDRQGNEQTETEWHRLVLWEGLADVADEYLSKGDRIYAECRIQYREWEGDDGRTRYTTELVVNGDFIMLGSPQGGGGRREPPPDERQRPGGPTREDKEIEGAAEGGGGDFSDFSDDALMGDDDLPF